MTRSDDLLLTCLGLLTCAVVAIISFRRHFAKHDEFKPRMVPWMVISLGAIATGFMFIVHLANLAGFETGRG